MSATPLETPDEVLQRLLEAHPHPSRRASLRTIDEVCRLQHKHGSLDFSLKTIGRLSRERQGPSKAAIANPNGAPYRQIIAAHRRTLVPALAVDAVEPHSEADLVKGVASPLQRARIKALVAEARRLQDEVRVWRRKANAFQAIANASATITLESGAGVDDVPVAHFGRAASITLIPDEQEALAVALDARRLQSLGLRVDARGRVLDASGRTLFPIRFATALAKAAAAVGVPSGDSPSVTVTDATS